MVKKTLFFGLLTIALATTLGCARSQSATQGADAPFKYEIPPSSTAQTRDMKPYRWPGDFKLPLIIKMDEPPVPKEIEGPSPPIEEKKQDDTKQDDTK